MSFEKKRWISLVASFFIVAFAGIPYAWSVFQNPLMKQYGWSASQVSLAFTLSFISSMLSSSLLGRRIRSYLSIRKIIVLGSILYGLGILMNGFIQGSVWELYLYYGILNGIGNSLVYPQLISYAMELFPERAGFASGAIAAGLGSGSIAWAPLAALLYKNFNDISQVFLYMGIFFMVSMLVLTFFLYTPPKEFLQSHKPASPQDFPAETVVYEYTTLQMVRSPLFYIMMLSIIIGLACGSMILGQASPIMQLQFGISATSAATIVSILAIANMAGRFSLGAISDFLGKTASVIFTNGLMLLTMIGLLVFDKQLPFSIAMILTIFSYGGFASLIAPVTRELFGERNIASNYSVSFSVFGLSSLVGPVLISQTLEQTGSYHVAYGAGAMLAALGLFISILMFYLMKKHQRENSEVLSPDN